MMFRKTNPPSLIRHYQFLPKLEPDLESARSETFALDTDLYR